jgi:hypothetical protein
VDDFEGHLTARVPSNQRAPVGRRRWSALWSGPLFVGLIGLAACGTSVAAQKTSVAGGPGPGPAAAAPTSTTLVPRATTCPLTAQAVSSIVGVRVYEQPAVPAGSCAFDSSRTGHGLTPKEVRVDVETGTDDLAALYTFFAQRSATDFSSCRPFRLERRSDLGAGGFETECGATPTSGPASVDDYLPTQDRGQLTVTVNRGSAVPDHSVATCARESAAIVALIRRSS